MKPMLFTPGGHCTGSSLPVTGDSVIPLADNVMCIRQTGWVVALMLLNLSDLCMPFLKSDHTVNIIMWSHLCGHSCCKFTFTYPSLFFLFAFVFVATGIHDNGHVWAYLWIWIFEAWQVLRSYWRWPSYLVFHLWAVFGAIWDPWSFWEMMDALSMLNPRQDCKNLQVRSQCGSHLVN